MIISEDRQSHLAHIIIDAIWDADMVEYTDEEMAMRIIAGSARSMGVRIED